MLLKRRSILCGIRIVFLICMTLCLHDKIALLYKASVNNIVSVKTPHVLTERMNTLGKELWARNEVAY